MVILKLQLYYACNLEKSTAWKNHLYKICHYQIILLLLNHCYFIIILIATSRFELIIIIFI